MKAFSRGLRKISNRPLPPEQITEQTLEEVGVRKDLSEDQRRAAATLAHYAFGAVAGSVFAHVAKRATLAPAATGTLFGLAVWGASYLGWLPAAGLRRSAAHDFKERNAQMIAAHLVWGAVAGLLLDNVDIESEVRPDASAVSPIRAYVARTFPRTVEDAETR